MTNFAAIARRAAAHPEGVTAETLAEVADYARRAEALTPAVLAELDAADDAADGLSPSQRELELLGLPLDDDAHPDSAAWRRSRRALDMKILRSANPHAYAERARAHGLPEDIAPALLAQHEVNNEIQAEILNAYLLDSPGLR